MIQQILEFQKKFSDYESVGSSLFIDRGSLKSREVRQIKASEIRVSEEGLYVRIDHRMSSYIKNKLSPVIKAKEGEELVDTNNLLLSLVLTKVYFPDKEENIYFPLVSIDLTNRKEEIFNAIRNGFSEIFISWEEKIVLNESITSTFFDISYEENGSKKSEFIAEELGDLVYEEARADLKKVLDSLYEVFENNIDTSFDLVFPKYLSDKSALFMFFNQKNEVKLKKAYDKIMQKQSSLLQEYLLYKQEDNKSPELDPDTYWLGSLTKDYPVGFGQGLVMQRNAMNDKIIPVVGGPGTGKTTLFLSLIANEVTKRAINIVNGRKDYNNLMLITSTANKAVDNVSDSLKEGFKHGFVYVGGNQTNKTNSIKDVQEYIAFLESREFSQEKYDYHKNKLVHYMDMFAKKRDIFKKVKSMNLTFSNFNEFDKYMKGYAVHATSFSSKELYKLEALTVNISKAFEILVSKKFEYFKEEFLSSGFVNKILLKFSKDSIVDEFNNDFNLKLTREKIESLFKILDNTDSKDIENYLENEKIKELKIIHKYFVDKEKFFNGIIKYDNFVEYARTNLFKMNYDLYITALNFMGQETLKRKREVLKALGYLIADNAYRYMVDNYGYSTENHKKFIEHLSLGYPVVTSTLAAVPGMFSTIKVDQVFNTVMADEAGMIASHAIVETLNRANRAIIVGDPKQLSPIVNINELFLSDLREEVTEEFWKMYSPTQTSAFHRAAGTVEGGYKAIGRGIMLDEHRRCVKKIADLFIEIAEYDGLKVCTPEPKTKPYRTLGEPLMFFHTKNSEVESFKKINFDEISKIESILNRLQAIGYDLTNEVGIITPYKDQERELALRFGQRLAHSNTKAKIGTVHKFQGVEYKVIIFSTVISREHDSLSFINVDPSMINVAVSRAKEAFMVVGDYDKLTEEKSYTNYAGRMSEYIKLNGRLVAPANNKVKKQEVA